MERGSPGISHAAEKGRQAQRSSPLPGPDSSRCNSRLQQHSGAFPVLLQAEHPPHSLEQGPAPGEHQSAVGQLFCSQREPRPLNTARLLQGAEPEKGRDGSPARDAGHEA